MIGHSSLKAFECFPCLSLSFPASVALFCSLFCIQVAQENDEPWFDDRFDMMTNVGCQFNIYLFFGEYSTAIDGNRFHLVPVWTVDRILWCSRRRYGVCSSLFHSISLSTVGGILNKILPAMQFDAFFLFIRVWFNRRLFWIMHFDAHKFLIDFGRSFALREFLRIFFAIHFGQRTKRNFCGCCCALTVYVILSFFFFVVFFLRCHK